jgi:DNA topoisomerase-1
VLSIVVKIIDQAYMRVGSAEYANDNDTYGITTIRKKHVSIKGSKIIFNYVGKSGINQLKELENPKIARAINQMLALPGYEVFKFHDSTGNICDVNAHNLNQFIDSITDGVMTAKNFRTWHGSVLAIERYAELYKDSNPTKLEDIYLYVSDRLGNTPAVVRDHYIHPSVIELIKNNQKLPTVRASKWLSKHEVILKKIIC